MHYITHGYALGIHKMRRDVGRLTFGYFAYSDKIGMTILVGGDGDSELTPITVWDCHKMTLVQFAEEVEARTKRVNEKKDVSYKQRTAAANFLPPYLYKYFAYFIQYVNVHLGFPIPGIAQKDQIGHYCILDVGALGFQKCFRTFYANAHTFGFTCVGAVRKVPLVIDGEIKIQSLVSFTNTGDHRFGDAAIFMPMLKVLQGYLGDPKGFDLTTVKEAVHWKERLA
jgi:2-oxoacid dehydrogenases acyltransferase (catalytic domain)